MYYTLGRVPVAPIRYVHGVINPGYVPVVRTSLPPGVMTREHPLGGEPRVRKEQLVAPKYLRRWMHAPVHCHQHTR